MKEKKIASKEVKKETKKSLWIPGHRFSTPILKGGRRTQLSGRVIC